MAVTRAQGWETPVPTFAETVFAPFAQAVAQRGKFDLEQQALDKRTIASALVQMGRLGVPGTQAGAPTFGFAGQQFPITEAPMDWSNQKSMLDYLTYGQPTPATELSFLTAFLNNPAISAQSFGKSPEEILSPALEALKIYRGEKPVGATPTATVESVFKPKGKKIKMKSPDGKLYEFDATFAVEAKRQGYTEVQ